MITCISKIWIKSFLNSCITYCMISIFNFGKFLFYTIVDARQIFK